MIITCSSHGHHMVITWSSHGHHTSRMLRFLSSRVVPWLRIVIQPNDPPSASATSELVQWHARLRFFFMQVFGIVVSLSNFDPILLHAGAMDSNDRSFVVSLSKFDPILNSRSLPFGSPSSSTSSSTIQTPCQRSMTSDAASK